MGNNIRGIRWSRLGGRLIIGSLFLMDASVVSYLERTKPVF